MYKGKIISLVPSITETLFYLGLDKNIAAVTKWCKYPEDKVSKLPKVGGVNGLNFDLIYEIEPDLIIAIKEENNKDEVLKLANDFNVYVGDIFDFESSLKVISDIGKICNIEDKSEELISELQKIVNNLKIFENISVAYFIWNKPMMVVGNNTFINDALNLCGFKNVFSSENSYIQITDKEIIEKKPEVIFLSSEPFLFTEKHKKDFQNRFPFSKVVLVDGEVFTWYGSHMKKLPSYLIKIKQML